MPRTLPRRASALLGAALLALLAGPAAAQPFALDTAWSNALPDVERSAVAWGDVDGDGDPDLVVTGASSGGPVSRLLRTEAGALTVDAAASAVLDDVDLGAVAWADLDGDGDLDLVLTGSADATQSTLVGRVYRWSGGTLAVDAANSAVVPDVFYGSAAWADLDGDGDPDLVLTGARNADQTLTVGEVFRNDAGTLVRDDPNSATVADVTGGSLTWADLDGDGDPDLVVTGFDGAYQPVGEVYRNDAGTLVRDAANSDALPDLGASAVAAGDPDGDGDPDLVVTGGAIGPAGELVLTGEVYRNDAGTLVRDAARSALVPDVFFGSAAWGGANGDGLDDLVVSGLSSTDPISDLLLSAGGTLTRHAAASAAIADVFLPSLAWGDPDGDGDLDLVITGGDAVGPVGTVLRNDRPPPVAVTGPDRSLQCTGPAGTVFTLDGSGSSDPYGTPLTYSWTGPFFEGGGVATGVGPTVTFASGVSVVTLTVAIPSGKTGTDDVTLTVLDPTPPQVARTGPQSVTVLRFSGPYADPGAKASDACDGTLPVVVGGTVDTTLPGVYTLTYTATDNVGNSTQVTRTVTVQDVSAPLLSSYAALAGHKLDADGHALIQGDLHANDDLEYKRGLQPVDGGPSRHVGDAASSTEIVVDDRNVIDGNLRAPSVTVKNGATVNGTVTQAAVTPVTLPTVLVTASGPDIDVPNGGTLTLAPGTYGEIDVGRDAVLTLGSGTYIFKKLDVDDRSRVDVSLTTGGTDVRIEGDLKLGKDVTVMPVPLGEADARFLTFRVAGDDVDIDDRTHVAAQIVAPQAGVELRKDVRMMGLLVGHGVDIKDRVELIYLSGGGAAPLADPSSPGTTGGETTMVDPPAETPAAARPDGPPSGLQAAFPNPARGGATVPFTLAAPADVRLSVHDALGREVAVLASGRRPTGRQEARLDGHGLPAGVYLIRLTAGGALVGTGRVTLVR